MEYEMIFCGYNYTKSLQTLIAYFYLKGHRPEILNSRNNNTPNNNMQNKAFNLRYQIQTGPSPDWYRSTWFTLVHMPVGCRNNLVAYAKLIVLQILIQIMASSRSWET